MIRKSAGLIGMMTVMAVTFVVASAQSVECNRDFMKDPCAANDYSVVESERDIKAPHNCMAIAHYFPGEEPEGYCDGGYKGKNAVRARTPVVSIN